MTTATGTDPKTFRTFAEFYPFYLGEHSNRTCRRLHFVGSTLALVCLLMLVVSGRPQYLLYALLCGYGFAWIGHFGFEKNKPASWLGPKEVLWSLRGDLRMWTKMLTGQMDAEIARIADEHGDETDAVAASYAS